MTTVATMSAARPVAVILAAIVGRNRRAADHRCQSTWKPASAVAVVIVGPEHPDFNPRRRRALRRPALAEVELDHARVFQMAAGRPETTSEDTFGDVDLMLFAIDVSPGRHAAAPAAYWMP